MNNHHVQAEQFISHAKIGGEQLIYHTQISHPLIRCERFTSHTCIIGRKFILFFLNYLRLHIQPGCEALKLNYNMKLLSITYWVGIGIQFSISTDFNSKNFNFGIIFVPNFPKIKLCFPNRISCLFTFFFFFKTCIYLIMFGYILG